MINGQSRVLVTGGAGFIGSHLVESLADGGSNVTVVDNIASGNLDNLQHVADAFELVIGDVGDLLRMGRLDVATFDYIYHLAANPYIPPSVENPYYDFRVNLHNTISLLEALRSSKQRPQLIFASSAAVYGNPVKLPIQEFDPTVPISPYGVSKLSAERYVAVYSELYGIKATSLRLFSVYGPRQRKQVVYDFLQKLERDPNRLEILGDGTQERDFVHVLDVVQAMILAANTVPGKGEAFNVASGVTYTISELANKIISLTNTNPDIIYSGDLRPGDAQKWSVDISRLVNLDYKPKVTLEHGLKTIMDWYEA